MIRQYETLLETAPNAWLREFVETAWSWKTPADPKKRSTTSRAVAMGMVEAEQSAPVQGMVDWPSLANRPDILVSIGRTPLGTSQGALTRLASGDWAFANYLTQAIANQLYFQNSSFPNDASLYLAGDKTFKSFVDSARAAFTGGDGIDIVAGDIRVDSTVSRVGHQHTLTLSGDVSGSGPVTGTVSTTVNAIRGGVVPPPGTAGYFYWTGSSYSWVGTPPPTTIALDDLADVALASVAAGQVLWYDGSVGQWINKTMVANDLPTHASRHHSGGSDPLAGQSIAGLLTSSSPTFSGLNVRTASAGTLADVSFRATTDFRRMVIRWDNPNDRLELFSNNDDGSSRAGRILIPRSSSIPVSILLGLTVTGTTTLSTSLTGILKATAGVVGVAGAADLPLHASRHQWDGADPIQGQQLSGLRAHETPTFGGIRGGSVIGYLPFLENNGTEIMRLSSTGMLVHQNVSLDGDLRIANLSGLLAATNGTVRLATALDLPAHTHYTSEVTEDTNLWFTYQRARDAITGSHPISVVNGVVSHVNTDGYKHVPANGTTNSGKFLVSSGVAGSYTWETISAGALPIHAFKHQWNGSDPLDGQSIEGLRTTSSPVFAGLTVGSLTGMVKATAGVLSAASASDLPAHASRHHSGGSDPLAGQSIAGLLTTDSPEFNRLTLGSELRLKRSGVQEWGMVAGTSGLEIASRNADWSAIDWPITIGHDAGGVIRLGGTTSRPVNLTYTLQMGGVDTITATREGRFTGLRLTNLSAGQIPVASDANGQITASGLTDDGTFLGISRTIRAWNSLARSGNTWTDLQWTQDANERVSILSSNSSGQYAYHSWVFVPPDAEATGRVLGGTIWGQKVSGKSGTAPGLKAGMYAKAVGSGGSTGGFGGQIVCNYRPDNGASQTDALRIGAFGGGVADAVETSILLRAKASFLSNFATIQDDAHLAPGLDILGTSNQGHIRILNNASASLLGGGIGDVEISGSKRVLIGNPGGGALLIGTNFTGINYPRFAGNTNWESSNRTGSASTADSETIVVYTGESNATESLPVASGSKRIIVFAHASNSGKWTLDADGTDMIAGELQANVGSITILPNSAVKQRRLIDHAFGLWVVI